MKGKEKRKMSKTKLALDVVNDLRNLAGSIESLVDAIETNETEVKPPMSKTNSKKTAAPKEEPAPEQKQPTLEEVRALMAEKNREGNREAVKAILFKYEVNKLTSLDPKHYGEVLKEVGEIK